VPSIDTSAGAIERAGFIDARQIGPAKIASIPTTDPDAVVKLDHTHDLALADDAWITVAAFGSGPYPRGMAQPSDHVARALTNPVYVDVDGNGRFDPPGARTCDFGGLTP